MPPSVTMFATEPSGTKWVVATENFSGKKDEPVKLYFPADLWARCQWLFDRQGINQSEAVTRMLRLFADGPEEMKLILLGQSHGNAALVLAREIIRRGGEQPYETDGMTPPRPPGKGPKK